MITERGYCSDCKRETEVAFVQSAGDIVCTKCGLVLEQHMIDEKSEWRRFADDHDNYNPVRVGQATNPLLSGGGLFTKITSPNGASGEKMSLGRWQKSGCNSDRILIQGFDTIALMCDRLALMSTIKDRANEVYKKVQDENNHRGRSRDAILAACLYIACRLEGKPRTVKEICSVANGAQRKEISRLVGKLEAENKNPREMGIIHASDYVKRFCFLLGMNHQTAKAAYEIAQKCEELDIRRSPNSLAAGVIYLITQVSDDKRLIKEIANAVRVADGTIKKVYKDLYPYASRLIPSWFANEESIRKLYIP